MLYEIEWILSILYEFFSYDRHDRYNDMETRLEAAPWGGDLTARAITGSGDNSRD